MEASFKQFFWSYLHIDYNVLMLKTSSCPPWRGEMGILSKPLYGGPSLAVRDLCADIILTIPRHFTGPEP